MFVKTAKPPVWSEDETITIVGAGPAGLACAIALARAGRKVLVREWRETVGSRFHGDFQGLENWTEEGDILEVLAASGIRMNFDCHPVSEGVAFDAWGKSYRVRSDRPIYYLIHRGNGKGSLDTGLLEQAREAGAEIRFGDRVGGVVGPAVWAGGPRIAQSIAVGYVFETDMADGSWICFDDGLAPRGYCYLLVHGGRGTVASCMFASFKREAECVEHTVSMFRERVGLTMRNPRSFGGFANFHLPRTAVQDGHPAVGEQAGFQDALAGFGLRYAMRSGILAAHSFIENVDYAELWRAELLPLMRTSACNRYIFNATRDRGWRWLLKNRLSQGDVRTHLLRLYRPWPLARLLFPLARCHERSNGRASDIDTRVSNGRTSKRRALR